MKPFLIAAFTLLVTSIVSAQELGLRLGDGAGLDFVYGSGAGRMQANIGWQVSNIFDPPIKHMLYGDVLWTVLYKPVGENFYWFMGLGGTVLYHEDLLLGAAGQLGIEHPFTQMPLVVGVDLRPTLWVYEFPGVRLRRIGIYARWNFSKNKPVFLPE